MNITQLENNPFEIERKIANIERKIERLYEKFYSYEISGKQASLIEQKRSGLMDLLASFEHQYYLITFFSEQDYLLDEEDYLGFSEEGEDYNLFDEDDVFMEEEDSEGENREGESNRIAEAMEMPFENIVNTKNNQQYKISLESDSFEDKVENEKECFTPIWVEENQRLGELGEKIALKYLIANFSKDTRSVSHQAFRGFDIECKVNGQKVGFEIKTSTEINGFFITINELNKAMFMKEKYNIFFIVVDEQSKKVEGFIINDPIETLKINYVELVKPIETDCGSIASKQFFYTFAPSFIAEQKRITLSICEN